MRIMNLLPKPDQREITLELLTHQVMKFWVWVAVSLLVLVIIVIVSSARISQSIAQTTEEIAQNQELLNTDANLQLQKQVQQLNTEIKKINSLRSQHYYWSNALAELGNLIPRDMVVDILFLDRATGQVEITGTAQTRQSVLDFWAAVHKSKYFRNINFPLTNLEKARDSTYNFTFFINEEEIVKP